MDSRWQHTCQMPSGPGRKVLWHKERKMQNCKMQPLQEMVLVLDRKLNNMLGTLELMQQISRKERLANKVYMGVWSCWSHHTAQIIALLPKNVKMQMVENKTKKENFCFLTTQETQEDEFMNGSSSDILVLQNMHFSLTSDMHKHNQKQILSVLFYSGFHTSISHWK